MFVIPEQWQRVGQVLTRAQVGPGTEVVGDPCVVWDEDDQVWRMMLFIQPVGHGVAVYQPQAGTWQFIGPLIFINPDALLGRTTHKPFIVMDAHRPNCAARIDGRYWLVGVGFDGSHKVIQQAWAERLSGPWTVVRGTLIGRGGEGAFDEKHADAVSAYYFAERNEIVYFYMGYPEQAQPFAHSPYGSALGCAIQRVGERHAVKQGIALAPSDQPGHWGAGYIGGLQLFPGRDHRWIGLVNASPTAPQMDDPAPWREEPPPSLGGFVYCDALIPTQGWHWCDQPIEGITDIPDYAHAWGEAVNLWRQHIWIQPDGSATLLYNSGTFGHEQLYAKSGTAVFVSDPAHALKTE